MSRTYHKSVVALANKQGGRCAWCGCEMLVMYGTKKRTHPTRATYDHLHSRLSPLRKRDFRAYAACLACNQARGKMEHLLELRGKHVSDMWIAPDIARLA